MQWIKASERLPNNEGNYFVKTRGVEENDDLKQLALWTYKSPPEEE